MNEHKHDTHFKRVVALYFIRSARGDGLLNRAIDPVRDVLDGTLYMFSIHWVSGVELSVEFLAMCVLAKKVVGYFLGWADEVVGFWKFENEYSSRKINPFNQELLDRVRNIEQMCDKHDKKD